MRIFKSFKNVIIILSANEHVFNDILCRKLCFQFFILLLQIFYCKGTHFFLDCTINLTFPVLEIQGQLKKINKVVIVGKQTKAPQRVYFGKFYLSRYMKNEIHLPPKPDSMCQLKINIEDHVFIEEAEDCRINSQKVLRLVEQEMYC